MRANRRLEVLRASVVGLLLPIASLSAQGTDRVSVNSKGQEVYESSFGSSISSDGRLVAFGSKSSQLVVQDTNGCSDVFVRDRSTGKTERVSVDSAGVEANGPSEFDSYSGGIAISADGRFVAFADFASNLAANDTNKNEDVFIHDRTTGITELVSVDSTGAVGNLDSRGAALSADGRIVAFESAASNLVAGDTNLAGDVFIHDRSTGITERVSVDSSGVQANDLSSEVAISANGRFVAFSSLASNLVGGDNNGVYDVFVHDRVTGGTARVSVDSTGVEGNTGSGSPSLSADGQVVSFFSTASNLVSGDTNGVWDVFVHDRTTGKTERVSVDSSGAEANRESYGSSISADGRRVAFFSDARNLVAGDTNLSTDVFVHDRSTGTTDRVSVDSMGMEGDKESGIVAISGDGGFVTFTSYATNLVAGDTNGISDIFVHESCSWTNYGAGFSGTLGIPQFTSQSLPILGTTVKLDLQDSCSLPTIGLVFLGFQRAKIHTNLGGALLLVPAITALASIPAGGAKVNLALPNDPLLVGLRVDLQAVEADPGAVMGASFTPGLELVLGR